MHVYNKPALQFAVGHHLPRQPQQLLLLPVHTRTNGKHVHANQRVRRSIGMSLMLCQLQPNDATDAACEVRIYKVCAINNLRFMRALALSSTCSVCRALSSPISDRSAALYCESRKTIK
jgi:hypothetical protein